MQHGGSALNRGCGPIVSAWRTCASTNLLNDLNVALHTPHPSGGTIPDCGGVLPVCSGNIALPRHRNSHSRAPHPGGNDPAFWIPRSAYSNGRRQPDSADGFVLRVISDWGGIGDRGGTVLDKRTGRTDSVRSLSNRAASTRPNAHRADVGRPGRGGSGSLSGRQRRVRGRLVRGRATGATLGYPR